MVTNSQYNAGASRMRSTNKFGGNADGGGFSRTAESTRSLPLQGLSYCDQETEVTAQLAGQRPPPDALVKYPEEPRDPDWLKATRVITLAVTGTRGVRPCSRGACGMGFLAAAAA